MWTSMRPTERDLLQEKLDIFAQRYPEFEFCQLFYSPEELRTNFIISAIGGSGPALVHGPSNNIGPWVELDVVAPLENELSASFLDSFLIEPFNANTWFKGHLYQVADRIGNHLCLIYNKALVKHPPQTMNELIKMGSTLAKDENGDGKPDRYALAWNYTEPFFIVPFIGGYGGWIMDDQFQPTLNTEAVIDAAQFIFDLADTYRIIPKECDYEISNALFKDGLSAMIINGPWSFSTYRENKIDFGIARIPKIDETGLWPTPMVSPRGYSINKNLSGQSKAVTLELLHYLTSEEVMLAFTELSGTIPARTSAYHSELIRSDTLIQRSIEQLLVGKLSPVVTELQWIYDAMRPSYQGIFTGGVTSREAAAMMQDNAERLIRENRQ